MWTDHLPFHNYMLQDVLGSLIAVLAFTGVFYAPGYAVAYAANLFEFRTKNFAERSVWAIACSFTTVPIAAYLVALLAGLFGINWVLLVAVVVTLLLIWKKSRTPLWSRRDRLITTFLVSGWVIFVLLMLIDVQIGRKLYFSVVMADQSYRIAFTDAVVRTGIPPANPLYFAGSPAPMRYYYFWYVLCAAVVKFAHVSARQAFIASSVWSGFGLLVTVKLFTQDFFHWERRRRWIAIGLLAVTGADLIPALGNPILQSSLNGDIEWWSVDPIDAWPDSLLWVPHHVASVICCLLGFLFLWRTMGVAARSARRWAVFLAAMAFASAFGLSVYVAFGFALMMIAWLVWLGFQKNPEWFALCRRALIAGGSSAVLLLTFLRELLASPKTGGGNSGTPPAAHIFSLSVRRMIDSGLLTGLPIFTSLNQTHPVLLDQTLRLLLLLPGLAMELGLYGAVLVLLLLAKRRQPLHAGEAQRDAAWETSMFFTLSGLVLTMFLSSSVITNNDFGYRAVMLPQFFLLLLTADVLGSWWTSGAEPVVKETPGRRRLLYSLLALGILGTVYGAFLLRAWLPIEAPITQNQFSQLPEDAFQIREAFDQLNRVAPKDAVVAFRPLDPEPDRHDEVMTPNDFYQRILVMDTGRQILNAEKKCAVQFGGDVSHCKAIQIQTTELYESVSPSSDWARNYCSQFGVQYLTMSHRDPNWFSTTGWPASLPLIADEPGFRIFACGPISNSR